MKKLLSILCFLFLFSGCSEAKRYPADDTFHFETDAQNCLFPSAGQRLMTESENGYYFTLTPNFRYIFYADKETMEAVPLCGKPNCLHFKETDEDRRRLCNAYITGTVEPTSIFYNNGRLFVPEIGAGAKEFIITEVALDGSSKKEIFSLKDEYTDGGNILFHRGYFYAAVNTYDENQNSVLRVWRYSLDHPNQKRELLYESRAEGGSIMDPKIHGNYLYFHTNIGGEQKFQVLHLTSKKQWEISVPEEAISNADNLVVFQNRLLFKMFEIIPTAKTFYEQPAAFYTADLDGENVQKWRDTIGTEFTADDRYIYEWTSSPYIYQKSVAVENPFFRIYDAEGNTLIDFNPKEEGIPSFYRVYIAPGEHVFFYDRTRIYYFAKSEIASGKVTPKLLIDVSGYGQ